MITTSTGNFQLPLPTKPGVVFCEVIHPDGSLNRSNRRVIEKIKHVYFLIEADPKDGLSSAILPTDFEHQTTLKWAIKSARLIVLWSCGLPYDPARVTAEMQTAIDNGDKVVILLIREKALEAWVRFAKAWAQPDARYLCLLTHPEAEPASVAA